ncbi:hypothetical protein BDV10DRAFT_177301, partial [Aspergillus recurvatus]
KDLRTACGLLKELLSLTGRVYLIPDRPEVCKRAEARLRNLVEASRRTVCVLKIFLVFDKDSMRSFDVDVFPIPAAGPSIFTLPFIFLNCLHSRARSAIQNSNTGKATRRVLSRKYARNRLPHQ